MVMSETTKLVNNCAVYSSAVTDQLVPAATV